MYILKSRREIDMMRRAGSVAHQILQRMRASARAGVSTAELDEIARQEMERAGAISGSKNYPTYKPGKGYPGYTCISVDAEIVHGIPGPRVLKEGNIVSLDVALSLDGYFADTAITVGVGAITPLKRKLVDVTQQSLSTALENIRPGRKWSQIARLIQRMVESHTFNVVREFVGHGVGRSMHEEPKVPNFWTAENWRSDFELRPGMTFAVEPMVVAGKRHVREPDDDWTMVTADGKPAAHFEHTIAVTEAGVEVLTDGRPPFQL